MAAAMSRALVGLPCFDGLTCATRCSFHLGAVSGHILPLSTTRVSLGGSPSPFPRPPVPHRPPVPLLLRRNSTESVPGGDQNVQFLLSSARRVTFASSDAGRVTVSGSFCKDSYVAAVQWQFSDLRFIRLQTTLCLGCQHNRSALCTVAVGLFSDRIRRLKTANVRLLPGSAPGVEKTAV